MKFTIIAMVAVLSSGTATTNAHKLNTITKHACDFLEEGGESMETGFFDEVRPVELSNVQLSAKDDEGDAAATGPKPNEDKVGYVAAQLGIPMTPELM